MIIFRFCSVFSWVVFQDPYYTFFQLWHIWIHIWHFFSDSSYGTSLKNFFILPENGIIVYGSQFRWGGGEVQVKLKFNWNVDDYMYNFLGRDEGISYFYFFWKLSLYRGRSFYPGSGRASMKLVMKFIT